MRYEQQSFRFDMAEGDQSQVCSTMDVMFMLDAERKHKLFIIMNKRNISTVGEVFTTFLEEEYVRLNQEMV